MNTNKRMINYMSNHNHTEHSNFRLKDCIIRAKDLVDRAIELGYHGVSVTDHETLSAHVQIMQRYQELKSLHKKYKQYIEDNDMDSLTKDKDVQKNLHLLKVMHDDFKLGLGNEIYLVDSLEEVRDNYVPKVTKFFHFILIAKDKKGYEQIRKISSESAWKNWFKQGRMERVPTVKSELEAIIGEDKGHIIAQTACLGGELANLALAYYQDGDLEAKKKIKEFVNWGVNVFGRENFFIELQPVALKTDDEEFAFHQQVIFNRNILKVAKAFKIDYVFTTDSHYLNKEDRNIHEAFLKSDEKESERELGDFYACTYMAELDDLYDMFSSHLSDEEIMTGFENTMKVHSLIEDYDISHSVIVPRDKNIPKDFEVRHYFKDFYEKYEYLPKFVYSEDEQERYLIHLIEDGVDAKRIEVEDSVASRLNEELGVIWKISEKIGERLASYYVLLQGLINNIVWNISYVGVARGSATGFLLSYAIGIIQINPMKYNLPYWRHLHESRPELPDIDFDSEASKRGQILEAMKDYYGGNNVLNTLTLKTEKTKSCVQTACIGYGLSRDVAQSISDMIPFERGSNWSLHDCFEGNPELERKPVTEFINVVASYDGLKEIMLKIENLVTGRSIHASSVYVFSNGYLSQNGRMRAPNGTYITCYNMHDSD